MALIPNSLKMDIFRRWGRRAAVTVVLAEMKSGAQPASTVVMLGRRQEGRGPNTAVLDLLVEGGWVTKTMVGGW